MKQGMFEYGTITPYRRARSLAVKTPDRRVWVMTGCSALSGQMTFKDQTSNQRAVDEAELDGLAQGPWFWGFTTDGELRQAVRQATYAQLLHQAVEASHLLKLGVRTDPFLTVEDGYPYLTDGHVGFRIEWTETHLVLRIPKAMGHKVLRTTLDPVHLDAYGQVLSPIQGVVDLIEKHEDVLCDPFADRNLSRKGTSLARTIAPGLRQKVRKAERNKKGVVTV